MAIDQQKLKTTRNPGVFRMPDGRLLAKVSVRTPDGKVVVRKQVMAAGSSEAEAVQAVLALKELVRNPPSTTTRMPLPSDTSQTFEDFCNRWLAIRSRRLSPATKATYTATAKSFLLPRLGHMPCKDMKRQVIEAWVVWAESRKQKNGKPYTQDTMRQWWRTLKTIVSDMAVDLDLADPTRKVRPPERPELAPVREQDTLTAAEIGALFDAARAKFPHRLAEVVAMALTGARAGEVYGLKWDAIDFAKSTIVIRRAVSAGVLLERTKTKVLRTVPLHPELAAVLREHRQSQIARQVPGLDTGLVFLSKFGTIRNPASGTTMWKTIRKAAKIDQRVTPQVLRRSLNTLMVAQGVDRITLRAIMGHTTEAMTQRYAGIGDAAKADALARVRPVLAVV